MSAANRSADIEPLRRTVRCTSPAATVASRITPEPGPPPFSLGERLSRLMYSPTPAAATRASTTHSPTDRGLRGAGLTTFGSAWGSGSVGVPNGLGTEALLIWNCICHLPNTDRYIVILFPLGTYLQPDKTFRADRRLSVPRRFVPWRNLLKTNRRRNASAALYPPHSCYRGIRCRCL